jgi:hypothetical protein
VVSLVKAELKNPRCPVVRQPWPWLTDNRGDVIFPEDYRPLMRLSVFDLRVLESGRYYILSLFRHLSEWFVVQCNFLYQ